MDREQEMYDTPAESGRETAALAPVVHLLAEDIVSIASMVAEILWRQGQREESEPTFGMGSMGSSSMARIDLPVTHSQSGKEVLKSLGTTG